MSALGQWASNVLYALDALANSVIAGDPRMTLSARMGRDIQAGRCKACRAVCWVLSLIQRDHCARAWADEQRGADGSNQIAGD